MRVVAVRIPCRCASTIPSFTSRVKPKSSALTMSLVAFTGESVPEPACTYNRYTRLQSRFCGHKRTRLKSRVPEMQPGCFVKSTLENRQLDAEKFLRVSVDVFEQPVQLARR